jgi:hypothetical protein
MTDYEVTTPKAIAELVVAELAEAKVDVSQLPQDRKFVDARGGVWAQDRATPISEYHTPLVMFWREMDMVVYAVPLVRPHQSPPKEPILFARIVLSRHAPTYVWADMNKETFVDEIVDEYVADWEARTEAVKPLPGEEPEPAGEDK